MGEEFHIKILSTLNFDFFHIKEEREGYHLFDNPLFLCLLFTL